MRFFIAFDNYAYEEDFEALWGFSVYIAFGTFHMLFDTGSNGRVLLRNVRRFGLDLKDIRVLFLSHPHWDHIGGLDSVIEENSDIALYLSSSFSPRLVHDLKRLVKEVEILHTPAKIEKLLYSTGTMGEIGEHGLIIDTPRGGVLVVGCSHPGIVQMVRRAKEIIQKEILYVIGGFHLFQKEEDKIEEVAGALKALNVRYVTPTHCSGKEAIRIFQETFQDGFIIGGAGRIIDLSFLER